MIDLTKRPQIELMRRCAFGVVVTRQIDVE